MRERILQAALAVIAEHGYSGTSLREIAEAVGLSQAGVLHYFESKDHLFTAVLERRDSRAFEDLGLDPSILPADLEAYDAAGIGPGTWIEATRRNAEVPGLVQLYTRLAADATEPDHPAHAYFAERYASLTAMVAEAVGAAQAAGRLRQDVDMHQVAVMLFALVDGLQTQWLMNPAVDMAEHLATFFSLLDPPVGTAD